jgi:hypothetical protein
MRYRLHIHCEQCFAEDEEGVNLPSLEAARQEAVRGVRSILCDELMRGELNLRGHIDVLDEAGTLVDTIKFEDAIRIVR